MNKIIRRNTNENERIESMTSDLWTTACFHLHLRRRNYGHLLNMFGGAESFKWARENDKQRNRREGLVSRGMRSTVGFDCRTQRWQQMYIYNGIEPGLLLLSRCVERSCDGYVSIHTDNSNIALKRQMTDERCMKNSIRCSSNNNIIWWF